MQYAIKHGPEYNLLSGKYNIMTEYKRNILQEIQLLALFLTVLSSKSLEYECQQILMIVQLITY